MVSFIELTKSNLRRKILAYSFSNPESSLYLREFARMIKVDPGNLSKEFIKLEKEGVFLSKKRGREKFYSLNKNNTLYNELKSIIFKTIGIKGSLKTMMEETSGIEKAFIYGSYAREQENANSDIDIGLLVNSNKFDEDAFLDKLKQIEDKCAREINYFFCTPDEWGKKISSKDSFIINIIKLPKIMLLGQENEIRRPYP